MSINQKLEEALNNQVIAEHQAALVYTQLAYELDRLSDWHEHVDVRTGR